MNILNTPLTVLKGIGEKKAEEFKKLGIETVYDMLYYFPFRYQDRSTCLNIIDLRNEDEACVKAFVKAPVKTVRVRKMVIANTVIADETGSIKVVFYNNRFVDRQIKADEEYIFFGKVTKGKSGLQLTNPVVEKVENQGKTTGRIIPVYRRISSLSLKTIQSTALLAVEYAKGRTLSLIPSCIEEKYALYDLNEALCNIHYPKDEESVKKARERFLFEDFFLLQIAVLSYRSKGKIQGLKFSDLNIDELTKSIPFKLTDAQSRTVSEIREDFVKGKCVKRLIQGDVGSGKTMIAVFAAYIAKNNGFQTALMVPTEILARQHLENFKKFLPDFKIELLTSSVKKKEKELILQELKNGEIDIVIGTHALIQDNVEFNNLGLVIADEQHRFGVIQRSKLLEKGNNPHLIVMTATPIPRTLSLIMYGDLDISVIDELPPGRQEIKTYLLNESYRKRAYNFVKKEIENGSQAYVVCPLVEESETYDLKDAVTFKESLAKELFPVKVDLIHGKMKDEEKNRVMEKFKNGETDVLVSTTVIEVGVDVKNAVFMIIEDAERFGLSQLHQLRGRVGRGSKQSYCFAFAKTANVQTIKRLKIFESSNDGFYISEQDLKLRGPGDFFGTRQSGVPALETAFGDGDTKVLYKAKSAVEDLTNGVLKISESERKMLKFAIKWKYPDENTKNILN